MMNIEGEYEAYDDTEALFVDTARMLECEEPSTHNETTDTRTPLIPVRPLLPMFRPHEAVLATAVDGGRGALCVDSMPSQGLHVTPPNTVWRDGLWFKTWEMGAKGKMWMVIWAVYANNRRCFFWREKHPSLFPINHVVA